MQTKDPSPTGWHRPVRLACGVLLAGLLTGCIQAHQHTVSLTLAPYVYKPVAAPTKAALELVPVKDSRAYGDEMVLDTQEEHSGIGITYRDIYVTKKPFAETFHDALNASLQRNGFETNNATSYVLESEIKDMDYETSEATSTIGVFSATTDEIHSTIAVNFELKDKTTGQSVWQQTLKGEDKAPAPGGVDGKAIARSYSRATEDVIRWLIVDPKFRGFFEIQSTNAP